MRNLIVTEFVDGFSSIMLAMSSRKFHSLLWRRYNKRDLEAITTAEIVSTGSMRLFAFCSQHRWKFDGEEVVLKAIELGHKTLLKRASCTNEEVAKYGLRFGYNTKIGTKMQTKFTLAWTNIAIDSDRVSFALGACGNFRTVRIVQSKSALINPLEFWKGSASIGKLKEMLHDNPTIPREPIHHPDNFESILTAACDTGHLTELQWMIDANKISFEEKKGWYDVSPYYLISRDSIKKKGVMKAVLFFEERVSNLGEERRFLRLLMEVAISTGAIDAFLYLQEKYSTLSHFEADRFLNVFRRCLRNYDLELARYFIEKSCFELPTSIGIYEDLVSSDCMLSSDEGTRNALNDFLRFLESRGMNVPKYLDCQSYRFARMSQKLGHSSEFLETMLIFTRQGEWVPDEDIWRVLIRYNKDFKKLMELLRLASSTSQLPMETITSSIFYLPLREGRQLIGQLYSILGFMPFSKMVGSLLLRTRSLDQIEQYYRVLVSYQQIIIDADDIQNLLAKITAEQLQWALTKTELRFESRCLVSLYRARFQFHTMEEFEVEASKMVDHLLAHGVSFAEDIVISLFSRYFEDLQMSSRPEKSRSPLLELALLSVIDICRKRGATWNETTFAILLANLRFPTDRTLLEYFLDHKCPYAPSEITKFVNSHGKRHKALRTITEFFEEHHVHVALY